MSSMPENKLFEFEPESGAPTEIAVQTVEMEVRQMSDKGYDFQRGGSAAFTAELFGSVSGHTWTSIVSLAGSGQGEVPAHYNLVKVNVTVKGELDGSTLYISGKVL